MTPSQLDDHRIRQQVENVHDLMAHGESFEHALAQAGVTKAAYDKHQRRHGQAVA